MKWFQPTCLFQSYLSSWLSDDVILFSDKGTLCLFGQPTGWNSSDRPERPVQLKGIFSSRIDYFCTQEMIASLIHLASAAFIFLSNLQNQLQKKTQTVLQYVQVKTVETMISLVCFPAPYHSTAHGSQCYIKQYLTVHMNTFRSLQPSSFLHISHIK